MEVVVCSHMSWWWEERWRNGRVFPLISGAVIEQVRPHIKLKTGTPVTSETESPCSFIHPFLPLGSSRAQTGGGLGCGFFFPHLLFNCSLKLVPPGVLWTLSLASGMFCPAWGWLSLLVAVELSNAEDLLFPWMWVPLQSEHETLPFLLTHL